MKKLYQRVKKRRGSVTVTRSQTVPATDLWTYSQKLEKKGVQETAVPVYDATHLWENVTVTNTQYGDFEVKIMDSFGYNIPVCHGVLEGRKKIDLLFAFSSSDSSAEAAKLLASLYSKTGDMASTMTFESAVVGGSGSLIKPELMVQLFKLASETLDLHREKSDFILKMVEQPSQVLTEDLLRRTSNIVCTEATDDIIETEFAENLEFQTTRLLEDTADLHSMLAEIKDVIFDETRLGSLFPNLDVLDEYGADVTKTNALNQLEKLVLTPKKKGGRMAIRNVIGKLENAKEMEFREGAITYVSPYVSKLTNLETLRMNKIRPSSEKSIDQIVDAFVKIPNLKALSIRNGEYKSLKISGMSSLSELEVLSNNMLEFVELSKLPMLQTLNVSHNKLTSLPDISQLTGLQTLNVSDNELTSLHDISQLTGLQTLDVSYNKLTSLPDISQLTGLQTLRLNPVLQNQLPPGIGAKIVSLGLGNSNFQGN